MLLETLAEKVTVAVAHLLRHRSTGGDANIGRFRLSASDQPGEAVRSLQPAPLEELARAQAVVPTDLAPELRARLFAQFLEDHAPYRGPRAALDRAQRQLAEVKRAAGRLNVMVLAERATPRETFVLERGVWDKPGARVTPDIPAAIAPWPDGEPRNRLGLARWIVSPDNPLTARVVVNHFWQMLFGAGLVRTPEDFGLQGERPVYPEILDWLAVEFMASGWDVKHLLTVIVTSATYRQESATDAAALARDPLNRFLARGARFRLPSWMLRDAALHAAGLLNPALGGPPVRPYQPEGVWEEMFMGRFRYEPSEGPAQYRRTLYAFWRRAVAPTFLFDSAQRRVCEVGATRTNTPLQALTLLNDQTYLEASRALATQALHTANEPAARLRLIFRHVLSREPAARELAVLEREVTRALAHYRTNPADAAAFLRIGQHPPNGDVYVADGYGSQFVLRFDRTGKYLGKFGGRSTQPVNPGRFMQAHGIALDTRGPQPLLVCTERVRNEFNWFTLEGAHVRGVYLPGAYVSRPVIAGRHLYSGVCFGAKPDDYRMWQKRGFVTILDDADRIVSNPGGHAPEYRDGRLRLMLQDQPVFENCHDVCVDAAGDLYVCQWNSGNVYPYKLHREA